MMQMSLLFSANPYSLGTDVIVRPRPHTGSQKTRPRPLDRKSKSHRKGNDSPQTPTPEVKNSPQTPTPEGEQLVPDPYTGSDRFLNEIDYIIIGELWRGV